MTEQELFTRVIEFERKHNPALISYREVEIWPLCRMYLREYVIGQISLSGKKKKVSKASQMMNLWRTLIARIAPKKSDLLILTSEVYYTDAVDGKSFDRHGDSLLEFVRQKFNLSINKLIAVTKSSAPQTICYPGQVADQRAFMNLFRYFKFRRQLQGDEHLGLFFEKIEASFGVDISRSVINALAVILSSKKAMLNMVQRQQPQLIVSVCYYTHLNFTMSLVAKNLGIPFADLQHGKQGVNHIMYGGWNKMPPDGYRLLPDFFLVWGKNSRDNISRYSDNHSFRVLVTGNLWMLRWKESFNKQKTGLEKLIDRYSRVVCFSLQQALEKPIPDFVLSEISGNTDVLWLFRLHPGQNQGKDEVRKILQSLETSNWEMEVASQQPLYAILAHSNVHMTCWSSVCIEALNFNLRSVIVHPNGAKEYEREIEEGLFQYADDKPSLKDVLNRIGDSQIDTSSYFASQEVAEEAFRKLLNY